MEKNSNQFLSGDLMATRYKVISTLGKGGMASVYKAEDIYTKNIVAVKVTAPEIVVKPTGQERFETEKEAFAKLGTNKNVIKLYDIIQSGDQWYIVLECINGGTLKDKMTQFGSMTVSEIKYYFTSICKALSEAHSLKIVHRDIKPDNVMLTKAGEVKLGDFGISVINNSGTETRKAIGTPKYMSPEVFLQQEATPLSDIYSLGIMMYEFSVGVAPFIYPKAEIIASRHTDEMPIRPRILNPNIPQDLENLILKMIEKNPLNRIQSADEVISELNKIELNSHVKPYSYHKVVHYNRKRKNYKKKIGNRFELLPIIAQAKWAIIWFALFILAIIALVSVLVFT